MTALLSIGSCSFSADSIGTGAMFSPVANTRSSGGKGGREGGRERIELKNRIKIQTFSSSSDV